MRNALTVLVFVTLTGSPVARAGLLEATLNTILVAQNKAISAEDAAKRAKRISWCTERMQFFPLIVHEDVKWLFPHSRINSILTSLNRKGVLSDFVDDRPFSKDGLIIAEFTEAETLLNNLQNELIGKKRLFHSIQIAVEQKPTNGQKLSEVERRVLLELCSRTGAQKVKVYEGGSELTRTEATRMLS